MKIFVKISLILLLTNIFAGTHKIHAIEITHNSFNGKANFDEIDDLLKAAFELYREKKYDDALEKCKKAGEINPNDPRVFSITGLIYMAQWQLKNASDNFSKAIELQPTNKFLYLYKSKADHFRNEWVLAEESARQAIKLDSKFAEAYQMLGNSLRYRKEKSAEAVTAYRTALELNPKLPGLLESLGGLYREIGDEKGSEELLRKGIESDPQKMVGRFDLGRMLVKQGRLAEARKLWEERTSDKDNTFPNFITVLERAENLEKAKKELAAKPDSPEALFQMGKAVMEGDSWVVDGRQEKAVEYFRKALKVKPNFVEAQFQICKAYVQVADTFGNKNPLVDKELAILRKMDAKLAKEIEDYRKNYSGGLRASPIN
ncbi:MAG TPA: tetratricopeptide repeat protein [Pyrinomonadaceae bacterium]|nr:tetratricopeptide repeat protein [Pyrinomonadaceae bacterium]